MDSKAPAIISVQQSRPFSVFGGGPVVNAGCELAHGGRTSQRELPFYPFPFPGFFFTAFFRLLFLHFPAFFPAQFWNRNTVKVSVEGVEGVEGLLLRRSCAVGCAEPLGT